MEWLEWEEELPSLKIYFETNPRLALIEEIEIKTEQITKVCQHNETIVTVMRRTHFFLLNGLHLLGRGGARPTREGSSLNLNFHHCDAMMVNQYQ